MARTFQGGDSDYLTSNEPPVTTDPATFSLWVYPTVLDGADKNLLTLGSDATNFQKMRLYVDSLNQLRGQSNDGVTVGTPNAGVMTLNVWQHAAYQGISTSLRSAWLAGVKSSEQTTGVTPSGFNRLRLGSFHRTPSLFLSGYLAEVAIWDIGLSDAEVYSLSQGALPEDVRPANLVYHLPMFDWNTRDRVGSVRMTDVNSPGITQHPPVIKRFARRRIYKAPAAPAGLSIPIAMHHYKQLMGAN